MENRLKSYFISPSLPPFLTTYLYFLSLVFCVFYSHSSSLLSRLSFLSTLSLPVFLLFFFPILPIFSFIPPPIFPCFQLFCIFLPYLPTFSSLSTKNCSSPFVLCSILIPLFLIFQFFVPPHLLFPYISFLSSSRFFTALSTL